MATIHRGRWTPDHKLESIYRYLPLEVPPWAYGLRVELTYDRDAATIDLGCSGPAGFRGWSGGARDAYVITADDATPGYLPGDLEPGNWEIMLGLYKVPAEGVEYTVTAEVLTARADPQVRSRLALGWGYGLDTTPPPVPERRPRRDLPAGTGRRWLAGDLHAHTVHSDGGMTVPELAAYASAKGLDFLAITDHNAVSHHAELPEVSKRYGITLLPGQEVTTPEGHANAFGDIGWIDFRKSADFWLDETERRGGLLSVNHPLAGDMSWIKPMRRRPPLAEIWHWTWMVPAWTCMLAWWLAWDPSVIPVGGSDWHREGGDAPLASPTTWIEAADETPEAVLEALGAGRVAIGADRDGPLLLRRDGELIAIGADGLILVGPEGPRSRITSAIASAGDAPGCHRLVDNAGGTRALAP